MACVALTTRFVSTCPRRVSSIATSTSLGTSTDTLARLRRSFLAIRSAHAAARATSATPSMRWGRRVKSLRSRTTRVTRSVAVFMSARTSRSSSTEKLTWACPASLASSIVSCIISTSPMNTVSGLLISCPRAGGAARCISVRDPS
jgi:hypothetical protein